MKPSRPIERLFVVAVCTAAVLPFAVFRGLAHPFITSKEIALRVLAGILLPFVAWIFFERRPQLRFGLLGLSVIVGLAVVSVSTTFSVDTSTSFWGWAERLTGLVTYGEVALLAGSVYLVARRWPRTGSVFAALWFSAWGIVALWAIAEQLIPGFWSQFNGGGARSVATIGNAIFLAEALLIVTAGAITAATTLPGRLRWVAAGTAAIVGGAALLFTETRGAYLGAAAGIAIGGCMAALWSSRRAVRIAGVAAAAACLLAVPALFLLRDVPLVQRAPFFGRAVSVFSANDPSVVQRFQLWSVALRAIREKPLTGWGFEQFETALDRHYPPDFTRYGVDNSFSDRAHNAYLDIAVATGLPGLAAYLGIFVGAAAAVFAARRRGALPNAGAAAAIGGIVAFAVSHLTAFDTHATLIAAAGTLPLVVARRQPPSADGPPFPAPARIALTVAAALAALALVGFGVAPLVRGSWLVHRTVTAAAAEYMSAPAAAIAAFKNPYRAHQEQRIANEIFKRVGVESPTAPAHHALLEQAESLLRHAQEVRPHVFAIRFTLANVLLLQAMNGLRPFDDAIAAFESARLLAPNRQMTDYQLGNLHLVRRDPEAALAAFRRALELDPSIGESHWHYGRGLAAAGRTEEAAREFVYARANGFTGFRPDQEITVAVNALLAAKEYRTIYGIYIQIADDRRDPDLYAKAAVAAAEAGDRAAAIDALRKAVSLDATLRAEALEFLRQYGYPEDALPL